VVDKVALTIFTFFGTPLLGVTHKALSVQIDFWEDGESNNSMLTRLFVVNIHIIHG
jgi:hypothetical protein